MRKAAVFYLTSGFCVLTGLAAERLPVQQETLQAVFSGEQEPATRRLVSRMSGILNEKLSLNEEDLVQLMVCADCVQFMELTSANGLNRQAAEWILTSGERLHRFAETVNPSDSLTNCFEILSTLYAYDPAGRDRWFDLMLAFSVVWDVPERPPVHDQEGKKTLPYKPSISKRYDYFKTLYSGDSAKIPYSSLTAAELVFAVDTPVPLSELEWARMNETGTCASWSGKYYSIEYDHDRLETGDYDWPRGTYTLSEIRERGGICVDQAYYAVMTARAFGIPAIFFHAKGKDGGHAWFSYMLKPGHWNLNVGRYESQKYTTGLTVNPQTNGEMTDHDVAYTCEKSLHSPDFRDANAYASIADVLLKTDPRNALRCAQKARWLAPGYIRPWEIETEALIAQKDYSDLLELVDEQKRVFSQYPDLVVAAVNRVEPVLAAAGREEEARRLRRSLSREVDEGRDDLQRFLGQEEIDRLVGSGDIRNARRRMEELLQEHIADGAKVIGLIDHYTDVTKETKEAKPAARFLEEYARKFEQQNGSQFKLVLLKCLLTAYTNADDEKGVQLTERQIGCYK
jgi:hypothetical protein